MVILLLFGAHALLLLIILLRVITPADPSFDVLLSIAKDQVTAIASFLTSFSIR